MSELGISLLISTYKSNSIVIYSQHGGEQVKMPRPMGIGVDGDRLAFGVLNAVHIYQRHLGLEGRPDNPRTAAYVPQHVRFTGDIEIHELHYLDRKPVFTNTRFSCLAELSETHSFIEVWRPPFIDRLMAEDRCHLNGFAAHGGKILFASAMATTNTRYGWRGNKLRGGVILDVKTGEVAVSGLCMPHSPRS